MEYIDEVDEDNNSTGKSLEKEEFHNKGKWYREVIGFVINEKQEILMQKRAPSKKDKPNMWEVCYGHVSAGETPDQAIIRELEEEIDLKISAENLILISIEKTKEFNKENGRYHNAFSYIYFIKTNKEIADLKMQEEEVSDITYIPFSQLKEMLRNQDNTLAFSNFDFMPKILNEIHKQLE